MRFLIMSKPITGKTTTSTWKQKRKNGDIYVWERQTVYIPETRKTKELSRKLRGKIPVGSTDGKIVPTRPKRKKAQDPQPQSTTRSRVGASLLLRWVGERSRISEDLLSCMAEGSAKKVDAIAQFWLDNQEATGCKECRSGIPPSHSLSWSDFKRCLPRPIRISRFKRRHRSKLLSCEG